MKSIEWTILVYKLALVAAAAAVTVGVFAVDRMIS